MADTPAGAQKYIEYLAWLAETMKMGNLHEVSRQAAAWQRAPDQRMQFLLAKTPNPNAPFLS